MGGETRALDPHGVLERTVVVDGADVPLWRALFDASAYEDDDSHDVTTPLLEGYGLSLVERLEVAIDIARGACGLDGIDLVPLEAIVGDEAVGRWAPVHADRLQREMDETGKAPGTQATVPLVLALVRNGIALEPRWDALLPVHSNKTPRVLVEIWRAVPDARREDVLLARLRAAHVGAAYPTAALLAPELRSTACARFLSEHVDKRDSPPRATVRAIVEAIDPAIAASISMFALRVTARAEPRALGELSPSAREQLLAALHRYDARPLPLEARLADGDYDATGSVASGLQRLEIEGDVAIEGFLYMGDSGTFFSAGTTDVLAEVIQGGVECDDPALGAALQAALRAASAI